MKSKQFLFISGSKFKLDKIDSVFYRPAHVQNIKTAINSTVLIIPPCLQIKVNACNENAKSIQDHMGSELISLNVYGYPAADAVKTLRSFDYYTLEESEYLLEQLNAELNKIQKVFDDKVRDGFAICNFTNFKENFSANEVKLSNVLSDIEMYQKQLSQLSGG
ncbi:hypothetical protein R7P80_00785 [Vibrio sp. 2092]|nr:MULTISPECIES: hypothetical protein [Vibrio]MCA2471310.1 hypothetical protein [Vibrio alginolyticus]MDW2151330.1 hypothetical protein [Vibrio sp. 2092]TVN08259.1 hypothetical protein FPV63_04255 [Vibrio cholerae]